MAIIKLGATVVGVRGTLGGLTYSANGGGPYVRQYQRKAPQVTAAVREQAANFAGLGRQWQQLSAAQRADWATLAGVDPEPHYNALGELVPATGWSYFTFCNRRRYLVGLSSLDDAPTGTEATVPDDMPSYNLVTDAGASPSFLATWLNTAGDPTDILVVFCRVFGGSGVGGVAFGGVFVSSVLYEDDSFDLTDEWLAAMGEVQPGWGSLTTLCVQRESGLRGAPRTTSQLVTS